MLLQEKQRLTKKKGLYALSAVIRGNTAAQQEFVNLNGLQEILSIIKGAENGSLRVKAVTLLFDLMVEQNEVMEKLVKEGKRYEEERYCLYSYYCLYYYYYHCYYHYCLLLLLLLFYYCY